MAFRYTYQTMSRITRHGINVYPLESFGLLLGVSQAVDDAHIIAALPGGKTEHWYEAEGRFAKIEAATLMAEATFDAWGLSPLGLYFTSIGNIDSHCEQVCSFAPKLDHLPWLVVRPVDGGEAIWASAVYYACERGWHPVEAQKLRERPNGPERNPKRIATEWNRVWGVLDYGNCHETELRRLGLA